MTSQLPYPILSYFQDLLRLIFPRECPACKRELTRQEGEVCLTCLTDIQESEFHLCPTENELYLRFAGRIPLEGAAALFFFDKKGKFQAIMQEMKYHNQPRIGSFLGDYYGAKLQGTDFVSEVERIIPVPLHPSKMQKRGYNQSMAICEGLSRALNLPADDTLLLRTRRTDTQTRKDKDDRWANVEGGFESPRPANYHLLMVDDIITTGATLAAGIQALYANPQPPKSVRILCLGMARKE
ncbi:MAG: ComF family protein [Bacteroidia bacterium]|nr:ComF family protein [Bacteroidia bacterium]